LARSKLGVVAGAGVVAAVLLIGDPGAAVSVADRGGAHSSHSGGGNRLDLVERRGGPKRGIDQRNRDAFGGKRIADRLPDLKIGIPRTAVGSSSDDTASDNQRAAREALGGNRDNLGVSRENLFARTSRTRESPAVLDRSHPSDDSATDDSAEPTVATVPVPPPAVVGNGRPPVTEMNPPVVSVALLERAPTMVARPGPAEGSSLPRPLRVVPYLGALRADQPTDRFLLAGLVLIPLVGASLGYRQARAAQAADALSRT
jgi:hypothetical protein